MGALVGLILAFSTLHLFAGNVLACVLPRLLIGVVAYYIWKWSGKKTGEWFWEAWGNFINTIGVLGLMVVTVSLPGRRFCLFLSLMGVWN